MNPGKISENVLKRSVLKNINNSNKDNINGAGLDCAIFTGYISNDSDMSCGASALVRACNNAYADGFYPAMASLSVTLPEKSREIKLKSLIKQADETARALGITITDGHTETVTGISAPVITATVVACKDDKWKASVPLPGQSIVMTKWMGMAGAARIARSHRDELETKLPKFIIEDAIELEGLNSIKKEAAVAVRSGAICMNDCSDGGIFAALWQLADAYGVGLKCNIKDIPVRQETIEICEFFDINPYKLRSDGALLIVTDKPDELINSLNKENVKETVIGEITDGKDRVITSGEDVRFLEEPRQDEGHML